MNITDTQRKINDKVQDYSYSVLLPVYYKDSPLFLQAAIDSMLKQTIPPEEIVIAVDGAIGQALWSTINNYKHNNEQLFSIFSYEKNEGLGSLLRKTLPLCRNEYIARMDADDYSAPDRIQKQIAVLREYTDVDMVGCNVNEFEDSIELPVAQVILPEKPEENLKYAKRRCPMRHPTLFYKKSDVLKVGNYAPMFSLEDYELVVRMLHSGVRLYNVQEPLVCMRISKDFYRRRGGMHYLKCMIKMKVGFVEMGFMSVVDFIISCGGQAVVILMPGWFREWFYMKFLRK